MNSTGKKFVDHWSWASEKGLMNKNTAGGIRTACIQVLSILENWETVDIKGLDVDETLKRFQNLKMKDFKPRVLDIYKQRFRGAVFSFIKYLDNPGSWKAKTSDRPNNRDRSNGNDLTKPLAVSKQIQEHNSTSPMNPFVEYPLPFIVRDNQQIARVILPRDLKSTEVKQLTAFLGTITSDFSAPS